MLGYMRAGDRDLIPVSKPNNRTQDITNETMIFQRRWVAWQKKATAQHNNGHPIRIYREKVA